MENRKRNVQIIVRVTGEERALIEEKMKQLMEDVWEWSVGCSCNLRACKMRVWDTSQESAPAGEAA